MSSVLSLLDISLRVLIVGILVAEFYLFFVVRRSVSIKLGYFLLVIVLAMTVWYLTEPPTVGQMRQPFRYFLFLTWIHLLPLLVFGIGVQLVSQIRGQIVRQVALISWTILLALVWPTFSVVSLCAFQIDCL